MKRLFAFVAVAVAAVAVYAVTAPAGQQAVTPGQFAALQKRVATLEKNLKKASGELGAIESCTLSKAIPVTEYGGSTFGFLYKSPNGTQTTTTALATTDTGDTAQFWVLTTTAACATVINGRKAPAARAGEH